MPCPRRQDLLLCSSLSACPLLHRLLVPLSPENPPSSVDVRSLSPSDGADRLTFPGGGRLVFAGHAAAARHLAAAKEVSARLEALAPWPSPWRACLFALNLPARTNPALCSSPAPGLAAVFLLLLMLRHVFRHHRRKD